MSIKETTLAYLAGMIDGDGYISITRSVRKGKEYFGAQVGIAGTRKEPHDLASSIWGGKVSMYTPSNENHRPQYQWSRVGASAVIVIEAIYTYLLIKKEHADLALELHDLVLNASTNDPFPWHGSDYNALQEMRKLRELMIEVNQSRNKVGKKLAGRLLDGKEYNEFPNS